MKLKLQNFLKIPLVFSISLISVFAWAQTPNGVIDFGNPTNGITATTANTGFGGVRVGSAGGGFTLQNPGQSIGTDGELKGVAPSGGSINSVGITSTEYGTAAQTFTIAFDLHLSGGNSGTWYFFAGNGTNFNTAQSNTFTGSQIFTGIRWSFGANNTITTNNRNAGNWISDGLASVFSQNTAYKVVIIGNNTSAVVNYNNGISSVAAYSYDLFVNGVLVGDNIGKAQLANGSNINGFRFYSENSTSNVAEIALDNISWYNTCLLPIPTWDGTQWIGGTPNSTTDALIDGDYTGPSFSANNITVNSTKTLLINTGTIITAGNLTNNGNIIVNDGGNFIQSSSGTYSGTGTFKVLKTGTSVQDKYAFWSSPVASQNLTAMYPGATPSFITEYNTATDYFVNAASTTSAFAKGYSIKTPAVSNAEFTGTPNNGTQTFTLSTAGNGYNLVGNPYPSNLDLTAFYNANSTRISNTFYFWDNTSNSVTVQGGATTTNVGYATYNPVSQIWTPAPNISVIPAENSVKIGQGFIVKATNAADTSLSFNNNMRIAAPATFYNKNNSSAEGKFWLRLNSSYNTNNTFAVAYINGASNSFDQYDSKAIGTGSDAFYTLAGTQKLVIQGRESFNINDVVPVGAKHFQNGNFTISLVQKEGIFNNGQPIYLHDKVAGTYTDLQNNTYSFTANSGDVSSRFEIVYKLGVLSTSEVAKDSFEVYRNGDHFVVKNNKSIDNVIVYDASGRQIQTVEGGSKEIRITLDAKGMYVVKAVSEGKEYTKKIIK